MGFRYQREQAKMSQKEVADKLGVDQSAVSLWETSKTYPRGRTLVKLAELYGCSVNDLLTDEQDGT